MQPLTLQEMAAAMEGRVLGNISLPSVTSVSTDSRSVAPGALFFAIRGERFDGHTYVKDVLERGAAAAVVSDLSAVPRDHQDDGRIVLVTDTVAALGRLASWYRTQFAAQVIAVVGSNGKTTTKDMIAAVLGTRMRGKAAQASFNNHIGVPLTLLSVEKGDEFVVVEIGTNHPGEVQALGRIARPDMVVVTSIGEEHLEFFGSLESVAGEEFSILTTMNRRAFAAISDQAAEFLTGPANKLGSPSHWGANHSGAGATPASQVVYGLSDRADLRAEILPADGEGERFKVNGRFEYRLPVIGKHNVVNALGAIAVATRLRLTPEQIADGLLRVSLPSMRMERQRIGSMLLINDAYNSNPSSVKAALAVLDSIGPTAMGGTGRKVLILGDMRELGEQAVRCHQAVGRDAGRSTANVIIAVGSFARVVTDGATSSAGTNKRIYSFPTIEALVEKIPTLIEPDDMVMLKASRGMQLERLMDPLKKLVRPVFATT